MKTGNMTREAKETLGAKMRTNKIGMHVME